MHTVGATRPSEASTIYARQLQCCNTTTLKISLFVFGLLLICGVIAFDIYQVNAISSYTMGISGTFLILAITLACILPCMDKLERISNETGENTLVKRVRQQSQDLTSLKTRIQYLTSQS